MSLTADIEREVARLGELSNAGFAIACHIRFNRPDFLFQTYRRDWIDRYSDEGLVMHDPIVRWGFANEGWIRWAELDDPPGGVLERARAYDMKHGIALGHLWGGSRSVGGFARSDRDFTDAEAGAVANAMDALHRITLQAGRISPAVHAELRAMSIGYVHGASV
ncbi:autoinducer binding domain-containing protein [Oceanicola granulosus]|uniref:autoinducer binding domain-containing protein n=1 Tax=Oceanicola granulosus TaxID=252302 RepID=UPI000680E4A2|nr:autoinducer binding domain-containing protein [Oceanicola granulosus]